MVGAKFYILKGKANKVVQVNDVLTWAKWFEDNRDKRHVGHTNIGDVRVSTVFLGLNHQYYDDGPRLIFETMIFGGKYDQYQWRYATWKGAEEGHKRAVKLAMTVLAN